MANNLDNFIPEVWSTQIVQNIDQNNVAMAVCANTDYEGEIRAAGDTVHVRTFGDVQIRDYVRGQAISYESLTPDKETLTVDVAKYFAIEVDDLDEAQNDINALQGYTARAGVGMAETMDSYIFSFHASSLTANQISNSGSALDITASTAGSTHVYDLLVEANLRLDNQDVAQDMRWAIVSPYYASLLKKDTVYFINGSDLGDTLIATARVGVGDAARNPTAVEALSRGFLGRCAGMDVYMSTNLARSASTNRYCLYGQGKPVSFAAQLAKIEAIRLESTIGNAVRGLFLYGGKVFDETSKRLGRIFVDNS